MTFRQHHAPGVAKCALVRAFRPGAGHIAQKQPDKPANAGVGAISIAECCTRAVEPKGRRRRTTQHHQRFAAGRVAAVLHAVGRVDQSFCDGHQHWHMFREAVGHDAVDGHILNRGEATRGLQNANFPIRRVRRRRQKGQHFLGGRRHNGQSIRPLTLLEQGADLFKVATADNARRVMIRAGTDIVCRWWRLGQPPRHIGNGRIAEIFGHLGQTLRIHMADNPRHGQVRDSQSAADGLGLAQETVANQ